MKVLFVSAALAAVLGSAGLAQAAVVAGPTIGGLATFTDTNTGRHWLKLNDFFDTSGTDMIAAATAAGFTVADIVAVQQLTSSLPLFGDPAVWNSYAAVMGRAPNRDLMWAAYVPDANSNLGWAYAYSTDGSWNFVDGAWPANQVANGGGPDADENLWAYTNAGGGAVPEPAVWALMIAGFGLVGASLRGRRLAAA